MLQTRAWLLIIKIYVVTGILLCVSSLLFLLAKLDALIPIAAYQIKTQMIMK
jgi:hypothetical protein